MAPNDFAIFVNTTDSFEDCWVPFFTLFKKYWPEYKGTIYLNTETKNFSFDGLSIIATQINLKSPQNKIAWSECLMRALISIPDDIVLYMQEDYFLHDVVKSNLIIEFVRLLNSTDIDCIHLTDQATPGPFLPTIYKDMLEIDIKAPYRISTQAALWKKQVLNRYLRKHENAWQFEYYATKRARILKHKLYIVNTGTFIIGQKEIIPYVFTGIIKGRWNKEVVALFKRNNIEINYSKRGFYELEENKKVRIFRLGYLKLIFKIFQSEIGLIKISIWQD